MEGTIKTFKVLHDYHTSEAVITYTEEHEFIYRKEKGQSNI